MPVQGDDVYYLAQAEHAQIDPLHPSNVRYVFQGDEVDMRGHSHPPFNAWFLGLLLAIWKDVYVGRFHLIYLAFSVISIVSVWSIAKRYTPHPMMATLLFLVTPAFVINGNSFESDLPFVAFWLASIALFLRGALDGSRKALLLSALIMILAALTAYQAVVLTPILWWLLWLRARRDRLAWLVTLTPVLTVMLYQLYERSTTGAVPVGLLAGYFQTYGFQQMINKVRSAVALSVHLTWLVFPALWLFYFRERKKWREPFLEGWIIVFFIAALVLFFAGSARYLLPIAAPVAILLSRPGRMLPLAFGTYLVLTLTLALGNFAHWEAYRVFARDLRSKTEGRVWINGEWGLRYYLEADGALPVRRGQQIHPGDVLVTSKLAFPVTVNTGGGRLTPVASKQVDPIVPLQLIGLYSHSGYSTASKGFLPFSITWAPIDRVDASMVSKVDPRLTTLKMNAPEAKEQLVSGFFDLEQDTWRWMTAQGVLLLKNPQTPQRVFATYFIPDVAPARKVKLKLDGATVAEITHVGPGSYTLESTAAHKGSALMIEVDKTFTPEGDNRQLGIIVTEAGFRD